MQILIKQGFLNKNVNINIIILTLKQIGWDKSPDLWIDTVPKEFKFKFHPNIDITSTLDQKF